MDKPIACIKHSPNLARIGNVGNGYGLFWHYSLTTNKIWMDIARSQCSPHIEEMRYTLLLGIYLAMANTAYAAPHCDVVYDGDPGVLEHEIAHCHGWKHGEDGPNSTEHHHPRAPAKFRKPYPNVTVYKASQPYVLCEKLTGESYNTPYLRTVRGCAVGGLMK